MVHKRLPERRRLAGGGDQVDVVAGLGSTPGRAGDLDRVAGGVGAKVVRELLGHRQHLGEQQPLGGRPVGELAQRRQHVLLGLRPEALELADPLLLGGGAQLLEARDAQLVVEAARRLRAHSGDHGHLDQGGRELPLQLRRGWDLAGVEQRHDLLLQRLADPGQLGRPAGAGQLLDRDGALPDHSGRLAVGEHAVPDRPVELIQRRQLAQGIGDLGVSHAPKYLPRCGRAGRPAQAGGE